MAVFDKIQENEVSITIISAPEHCLLNVRSEIPVPPGSLRYTSLPIRKPLKIEGYPLQWYRTTAD